MLPWFLTSNCRHFVLQQQIIPVDATCAEWYHKGIQISYHSKWKFVAWNNLSSTRHEEERNLRKIPSCQNDHLSNLTHWKQRKAPFTPELQLAIFRSSIKAFIQRSNFWELYRSSSSTQYLQVSVKWPWSEWGIKGAIKRHTFCCV